MVYEQDPARRADALAYICEQLRQLRSELDEDRSADGAELLNRLAGVLTSGAADPAGILDQLHGVLQDGGDDLGLYGRTGDGASARGVRIGGVATGGPPASAEAVYLCPARRCSRSVLPSGPGPVPTCTLTGERLRWEAL